MDRLIVGVDYSITSPGVVVFGVDEEWNRTFVKFKGFTEVRKKADLQRELVHYKKDHFSSEEERFDFMSNEVVAFIRECTAHADCATDVYVAIEGYALGAKGLIFNIAEATGLVKHKIWNAGYRMRIYEPGVIKKFATGKGNCDKVGMGDAFIESVDLYKPELSEALPDYESPKGDLVDAYWIAVLLYNELLLRHGIKSIRSYTAKQIEVFNSTSDKKKDNILCREFIHKLLVPRD
jgi:Holliday junction resolvasome RuvABC endonuclease subunit